LALLGLWDKIQVLALRCVALLFTAPQGCSIDGLGSATSTPRVQWNMQCVTSVVPRGGVVEERISPSAIGDFAAVY